VIRVLAWIDQHAGLVVLAALLCAAALFLAACGTARPLTSGGDETTSVAAQLAALGSTFLWLGGIAAGLGVVVRIASAVSFIAGPLAFLGRIPGLGGILSLIPTAGAASVAVGACFIWLGNRPWLLGVALVATGLAVAYRHRASMRRWLRVRPDAQEVKS